MRRVQQAEGTVNVKVLGHPDSQSRIMGEGGRGSGGQNKIEKRGQTKGCPLMADLVFDPRAMGSQGGLRTGT